MNNKKNSSRQSPASVAYSERPLTPWRAKLHDVIIGDAPGAGHVFEKILLSVIVLSLLVVMIDSVESLSSSWDLSLKWAEWLFTGIFTVEYVLRLLSVRHPWRYVFSFFGLVDLLAVLPTYLAVLFPEIHALIDVRVLRLLRVFRVFKLTAYVVEFQSLGAALQASLRKIMVFVSVVSMVVVVLGSVMYVVEGPVNGYTSIPTSIYWAITTMTTVGFGDITPKTELGRFIASMMMLLGWGTLAVPTGIVTAEMTQQRKSGQQPQWCARCAESEHLSQAHYCHRCGNDLRS